MISRLIGFFIRKRSLAVAIAIFAVIYGYYSWTRIAVDAYPAISGVSVQLATKAPGLASEEVEQQITIPLERALASTPGLSQMRSSSTFSLSLITMLFRDGAEDYWERQRVLERINGVSLPSGVTPGFDPVTDPSGEIYRYTLESDSKNLLQLSEIQRWTVIPALMQIPGVANVDNFGGFTMQYQLELDPEELDHYGIGLNDVITALNNNNTNAPGGRISRGEQSYVIRGIGQVHTLADIGNIVVAQHGGVPVLVHDLGKLQLSHQEPEGILGKNNNPDTLEGIVELLKGENASGVLKSLHSRVNELQRQLAPQGVRIVPYIDRDNLVKATVDKVSTTVTEGVGLVCIVLMLFLGSARAAMIVAVTIPLALVVLFILMNWTGMPANLFSLGAIDFGIIVDGAVVVTDAILRRREAAPASELTEQDISEATVVVGRPIFFATLIIISAYFPLFALQNAEAKLFTPMAYTIGYALFGALVVTFTLVPGLAYWMYRRPRRMFRNRPLEWVQRGYRSSLSTLLDYPLIAFTVVGGVSAAVILLATSIGRDFLPELDEGALWLQVQLPTGLSLGEASKMADDLRHALLQFPEVSYAITQLGRDDTGVDPFTPSHIEAPVGLKPYGTWPAGDTKAAFLKRFAARLQQMPGYTIGITQPIADMVDDLVGGTHSPLTLNIVGDDLNEMRRIGGEIVGVLRGIDGTEHAAIFQEPPIPQIGIEVDRAAAARYGINVSDIMTLIQTGVAATPISQVYVGDRIYDLTVRFPLPARDSPAALSKLLVVTSTGARIPLSEVARVRVQTGESNIAREMGKRVLSLDVTNRGRDISSYLEEAQRKIAQQVHFDYSKYQLQWGGQFENEQRAEARFKLISALVLAIMMVLLFAEFGKIRQAVLILATVPLATLGGLLALRITGQSLNVATAVGFIALFGVAVQNGIIMVANLNRSRARHLELRDAVIAGASGRLRPVLMTATVATGGMLPAALATGIGTDVQRSVATVVVGGLLFATTLTLFILPTLYFVIERRAARGFFGISGGAADEAPAAV